MSSEFERLSTAQLSELIGRAQMACLVAICVLAGANLAINAGFIDVSTSTDPSPPAMHHGGDEGMSIDTGWATYVPVPCNCRKGLVLAVPSDRLPNEADDEWRRLFGEVCGARGAGFHPLNDDE